MIAQIGGKGWSNAVAEVAINGDPTRIGAFMRTGLNDARQQRCAHHAAVMRELAWHHQTMRGAA